MSNQPQRSRAWSRRAWMAAALGAASQVAVSAIAQPPVHYFHDSRLPLGAVAQGQLARHARMRGYVQPVEFHAPRGVMVSVAEGGSFGPPEPAPVKVGLQIGHVYRFKVMGIPLHEGEEVFPSVELINRLHPPEGQRVRFPIPIELSRDELEMALAGNFVTRVIYLEDPSNAFPMVDQPGQQRNFEVSPGQDPLEAADKLGRPMAILRIGSRVPLMNQEAGVHFGAPPVERYPNVTEAKIPVGGEVDQKRKGLEPGPGRHYSRQPIGPVGVPLYGRQPQYIAQPPATRAQR